VPDVALPGRLGLYLSMVRYGNAHNRDFAIEHHGFFVRMLCYLGDIKGKRVLDVGCGKSFWLSLLLHSAGAEVTGIDTEVVVTSTGIKKYWEIFRTNGVERTLRTLVWDVVYARPYYRELAQLADFPLKMDDLDLRSMNSNVLDFPDNTFDIIVSHEVFEHIADVAQTVEHLHRVIKPQGLSYIYIHNYTSLSGGHHIAWKYPDTEPSENVPPWDHLRDKRHPWIPSWLNELREHDYRAAFEQHFEIVDWIQTETEGKQLLTDVMRAELKQYSDQELLTKGFVVVAKPKFKH
jgi:SAM-dependent methyltransferase